jgi:microcystin-dependent protein
VSWDVPIWLQGGTYPARLDRMALAYAYDEGVMDLSMLVVTQRAAGANFSVDVSTGTCVVQGDDQTDQGNYFARCTVLENLVVSAAPGSNSRYDIVCVRINDPNAGGNAGNTAQFLVVAGTPAASPTVPAVPASCLLLAVIGPIATATASITNSLIHTQQTGTGPTEAANAHVAAGRKCKPGTVEWQSDAWPANGWLIADGRSLLRSSYAGLFAHIGTTYGAADGTHFNLPDYRGRTPLGLDNMGTTGDAGRIAASNTLGGSGGYADAAVVAHTHSIDHDHPSASVTITDPGHVHDDGGAGNFLTGTASGPLSLASGAGSQAQPVAVTASATTGISATVDLPNLTGTSGGASGAVAAADRNLPPYIFQVAVVRT